MAHSIWNKYPTVAQQLDNVQTLMRQSVKVKNREVASKIDDYIISGGKMLRPALTILFANLRDEPNQFQIIQAAAATELFHIATLLHDDVIDGAEQRRGMEAFQLSTSNRTAIYAGDYLITLSALLFHRANYELDVIAERANSMHQILAGELFQYNNLFKIDMTLSDYLKQIKGKTAKLFALSAFLGRFEQGIDTIQLRQAKQAYLVGEEFGMAFQIIDDLLDYVVDVQATGKPRMQDVKNGIYTAPLLFAMQSDRNLVTEFLSQTQEWTLEREQALYQLVEKLGGFVKTQQLANRLHLKAVSRLNRMAGNERAKQEIATIFESVLHRNF